MIKLIVFDMDGTLLNSNKELPKGFFEVVTQLKKLNIKLGIGSGRQYQTLYNQMGEHADDFVYFSDNGTLVYEGTTSVYTNIIDKELSDQALLLCRELNCLNTVGTYSGAYLPNDMDPDMVKEFDKYYVKQIWVDDLLDAQDITKISIYDPQADYQLIKKFEVIQNKLQVVQSGPEWIDIMNLGATKGAALKEYQQQNRITPDETMTFGDAMNDYEMMQQATYSFAMENAQQAVKDISNFLTLSNDEEGVLVILNQLLDNQGDPSCFIK